jgi:hypothetical protein
MLSMRRTQRCGPSCWISTHCSVLHATCDICNRLQGLKTDTDAEREAHASLQAELVEQHPKHLPLLRERLARLEKLAAKVGLGCNLDSGFWIRVQGHYSHATAAAGAAGPPAEAGRQGGPGLG